MSGGQESAALDKWQYVVLLAKFSFHILWPGVPSALSVLIPTLVYQLQLDYTQVGLLVSLCYGMMYLACPIANALHRRIGARALSVTSALLAGISFTVAAISKSTTGLWFGIPLAGLFSSPLRQISSITLRQHFGERFGVAEVTSQIGVQVGDLLMPYLTVLFLEAYGVSGALLCLGGCLFHLVPIGATLRPPHQSPSTRGRETQPIKKEDAGSPQQKQCPEKFGKENERNVHQNLKDDTKLQTNILEDQCKDYVFYTPDPEFSQIVTHPQSNITESKSAVMFSTMKDCVISVLRIDTLKKEPVFTFVLLPCQALYEISFISWAQFMFSYAVSEGVPDRSAVYLQMAASLAGAVSRLLLAGCLFLCPLLSLHFIITALGLATAALFIYPLGRSLPHLIACSCMAGVGYNCAISSYYMAISVIVKKEHFPAALSISFLLSSLGIISSGALTGLLYDTIGSFPAVFRLAGVLTATVSVALATFLFVQSRLRKKRLGKEITHVI